MNHELKQMLLQSKLCRYLDINDVEMLVNHSKVISFEPDAVLLEQGKKSIGTYIIISGTAVVNAKVISGNAINLALRDKGDCIGEISLVLNAPSTVSTIAQTPMECLFISSAYFETLALFFPATRFKISKALIEDISFRLKLIHKKITAFMAEAHMASKSMFGNVLQSLTRPKAIKLEEAGIQKEQLKKMDFFKNFNAAQLEILFAHAEIVDAVPNCTLIKSGEKTPACYLVMRGAVQSTITEMTKRAKISVLGPLSFFCCMSYIDGSRSIIDFTTCEHTVLLKISVENLEFLKKNHIEIWYVIYDEICKSFAALEQATSKLDIRLNSELYNR